MQISGSSDKGDDAPGGTAASGDPFAKPADARPVKKEKKEDSFPVFLLKLAVIVFIFRSFIFSPFNIPSESMLPRLLIGDYLLASKWSYGYTRYSLPFSMPLIPFGALVDFVPPPEDSVPKAKQSPNAVPGIYLGWFCRAGARVGPYL